MAGVPARPGARTVRVVPDVVGLGRRFDYLVPPAMASALDVGTEIRVPLHGRRIRAWVVELDTTPPAGVVLQPVAAVRGVGPPAAVVELASWAAWRWAGSDVHFLRTASSSTVVRGLPPPGAPSVVRAPLTPLAKGVADAAASPETARALAGGTTVLRVGPAGSVGNLLRGVVASLAGPDVVASEAAGPPMASRSGAPGVLVVVPEVRQIGPLAAWLRTLGVAVAMLPEQWERARTGGCVAVGTRAAAWAPLPSLAAAVVLDAHDRALVEQRSPTWSAVTVVAERARRDGGPCVLVSPCPTVELAAMGTVLAAGRSVERRQWPAVELVDLRDGDPRHGLLSGRVVRLARWAGAAPGRRLVCVVNRTGGARLVLCGACGEIARCGTCSGPLELASEGIDRRLRCGRCGTDRPVVCARCGSTATRALRHGVTRLRRELERLASGPVAELTAASDEVGDAPVVVGTEAALRRGLRADVVVLLDIDGDLLAARLDAGERALALVALACRAVRRSTCPAVGGRAPGQVVVQTRQPSHPVLRAAVAADPTVALEPEMEMRRLLRLPPVTAMAQLSGPGAPTMAQALARSVRGVVDVDLDGPHDGIWSLRAPDHQTLCDLLGAVARPADRVRVDVDPRRL